MNDKSDSFEEMIQFIELFDEKPDERERVTHTMLLHWLLIHGCSSLEDDLKKYQIAIEKLIDLSKNDRFERVRVEASKAIHEVAEKLHFSDSYDLIANLYTKDDLEWMKTRTKLTEFKTITKTFEMMLDRIAKVKAATVDGDYTDESDPVILSSLLTLQDDMYVRDWSKYRILLSHVVDLYNSTADNSIRESLWDYFEYKSNQMGYYTVEDFLSTESNTQLIVIDTSVEKTTIVNESNTVILPSSSITPREKCMVSGLPINFEKEEVVACPNCKNQAKRSYLFEWLRVKGFCPMCKEQIKIEACLRINF